ncbi:MAG: 16S rRNA processing protein RimM [Rhodospirillales bacterium]|nr:16S rRNA processing protein RimM [Rhodospirillales bacterium]
MAETLPDQGLVLLGEVVGVQGVKGLVRIRSHTARPADLAAYGPLVDEGGRRFVVAVKGQSRGNVLASLSGVADRDAALALRGTKLYVARSALPPPEDEDSFYQADLIGLRVEDEAGQALGRVAAVENFGAGDLLRLKLDSGAEEYLPFTKAVVPLVEISQGRMVIRMPAWVLVENGKEEDEAR